MGGETERTRQTPLERWAAQGVVPKTHDRLERHN